MKSSGVIVESYITQESSEGSMSFIKKHWKQYRTNIKIVGGISVLDARKINLLEFIGASKRTFNIPVYQRNYDWKKEHCERLFRDIESVVVDGFEYKHFLGTVVYVSGYSRPNFSEFILIDGQQRITSIMLLLLALYDEMQDNALKDDIYYTYITNERAEEKLRVKLKPIVSDMIAYDNLLTSRKMEEHSNICSNFSLFKSMLQFSEHGVEDIFRALSNIEIVYIQLDKDTKSENPQLIFESLNSTGLNLLPSDLIRNYLLMNHDYEMQKNLYENYWLNIEKFLPNSLISNFIRDYLTMKTGNIPIKDKVYDSFKEFCKKYSNFTEEGILEELVPYAKFYSWFINCNCPDENINKHLSQIQKSKATVVYPVLLSIFEDKYVYKKLDSEQLSRILQLFTSYLFRRSICDYPANALNKIFASLAKELEKWEAKDFYERISKFLLSKTGKGLFPRDEQFKAAFVKKDFYTSKLAKESLYQLESYLNKEKIDMEDIEIEHIMPQTLSPKWMVDLGNKYSEMHTEHIHTIGNLTLTGYNPELKNKSFFEKKVYYKNSNISITRSLVEYESWNDVSIKLRAVQLFEDSKKIWSLPYEFDIDFSIDRVDFDVDYNIMDDVNVTGFKPKQLTICDEIHSIASWKDMLKTLCSELLELDAELFKALAVSKDFEGKGRRIIAYDSVNMNSPYEINEGLFIETNLGAVAILNYCKLICEKFELQEDVFYKLRVG